MSRPQPKSVPWALLALGIAAAGAALRLLGSTTEPLWLDEAYSAYAASKGWHFLWHVVPAYETHPPFYYSLLRAWSLPFGDSLPALRALGIIASIATLAAMALAARDIARAINLDKWRARALVVATLALAAVAPLLVEMAHEVRPYPVLIFVYSIAIASLLRVHRRIVASGSLAGRGYALYLASQALILWLHNLGPLFAASLGLGLLVLIARRGLAARDWAWLGGGHLLVGLAYLPAFLILIDQAPTWVQSTWLHFSFDGLWWRVAVLYTAPGNLERAAALLLGLLGIAALIRAGEGRRIAAALLLAALLPVALSITLSALVAPVFIVRTMTPVAVPALLLMATGGVAHRGFWRWAGGAALLVLIAQMALLDIRASRAGPMQDWYGTVRWLAPQFRPGDIVYAYPNEGALPFDRAVRDLRLKLPSRPIPTPVPSLNPPPGSWYVSGSRGVPSLDRAHLRLIADQADTAPTVWLLRLGPWAYDKGDVFLQELERDRVRVGRWRSGPIDLIGLRRKGLAPVAPAEQPQP